MTKYNSLEVEYLKKIETEIYKTIIRSVIIFGCETWTLNQKYKVTLEVFEKIMRRIYGRKKLVKQDFKE